MPEQQEKSFPPKKSKTQLSKVLDTFLTKGLSFQEYFSQMENKAHHINLESQTLTAEQQERQQYTKLNYQRSKRVQKTYIVSEALKTTLENIDKPQFWAVLTESWCGDSAQSLPAIAKMTEVNPLITLKILLRDENIDIMMQYLTNGKQEIPKLIAFNESGKELFLWGPRPEEASKIFRTEMAKNLPKQKMYSKLHLWYGKNKGKAVEQDFLEILTDMAAE